MKNNKVDIYFEFNLLKKEDNEDKGKNSLISSITYSGMLISIAALFFFILSLFELVIITAQKNNSSKSINVVSQELSKFDEIRIKHGEYVFKSNQLEEVILESIKLDKYFEIINGLVGNRGTIVTYSKSQEGKFSFTTRLNNYQNAVDLIENVKSNTNLENVFVTQFEEERQMANIYNLTIEFNIK